MSLRLASLALTGALFVSCATMPALAQSPAPPKQAPVAKQVPAAKQAPAKGPAAEAPPPFKEVALTDKQVEGVLAAQKDFDAIAAKLPQKPSAKPDLKIVAQLEDTAKKNGFASYAEYNDVLATIGVALGGFDPQAKTYIGPEAALKQQMAAVQADTKMPAKDKKAALAEMNEMMKSPPPAIQNKANIDLVTKYYDKLAAAMQAE